MGPSLGKMGKFPTIVREDEDPMEVVERMRKTIKY